MGISKKEREKSDKLAENPLEHWEQVQVAKWLEKNNILFFAVPNGAFLGEVKKQSIIQMNKLKAEGFKEGVYDLFIMEPRKGFHGCILEMKRLKGKGESDKQKKFGSRAEKNGYYRLVCRGHQVAIDNLRNYLDIENELPF